MAVAPCGEQERIDAAVREQKRVDAAIKEGRRLTDRLFKIVATPLRDDHEHLQVNTRQWWKHNSSQWTDSTQTGRANLVLKTIDEALSSIKIGVDEDERQPHESESGVSSKVMPYGFNIPITFSHNTQERSYETIFNIIDGVICITHVQSNGSFESQGHSASWFNLNMSAVIGCLFLKLHTLCSGDPRMQKSIQTAKKLVKDSVTAGQDVPELPSGTLGSWLSAAITEDDGYSRNYIQHEMRDWLNYILIHVSRDRQAHSIIRHLLGTQDVRTLTWTNKQEYAIGTREYYSLLGSEPGQSVAWMLTKFNDPESALGAKVIYSITLFHANHCSEMTTEDVEKYYTPVLLFKIVERRDKWRTKQRAGEAQWTEDFPAFRRWDDERLSMEKFDRSHNRSGV